MLLTTPANQLPPEFSQGDVVTLTFLAMDDQNNPVDISGASFSTQILGANGVGPIVFANGQHTITDGPNGVFTLDLSALDTANCGLGQHKEILTTITLGTAPRIFRGENLLAVYPAVPIQ